MYINFFNAAVLAVLIPPQNVFKMFPQILGLENIAVSKDDIGILQITIGSILFNLEWWLWSLIHHPNPLLDIWQRSA